MDREVWRATVRGVAKSWTRLRAVAHTQLAHLKDLSGQTEADSLQLVPRIRNQGDAEYTHQCNTRDTHVTLTLFYCISY